MPKKYIAEHGRVSWELDALEPSTITELIKKTVAVLRNDEIYEEDLQRKMDMKNRLQDLAMDWGKNRLLPEDALRDKFEEFYHAKKRRPNMEAILDWMEGLG